MTYGILFAFGAAFSVGLFLYIKTSREWKRSGERLRVGNPAKPR